MSGKSATNAARIVSLAITLTSVMVVGLGQSGGNYHIGSSVIAAGDNGPLVGGSYSLNSTAGETAASSPRTTAPFSLHGGFWPTTLPGTVSPTAAEGRVSGRVTNSLGGGVAGVVLKLTGSQSRATITDADGNYRFENVETNGFYTVSPSLVNFAFNPGNRSFSLVGDKDDAVFIAANDGAPRLNPLDTPEFFVRQQYVDFLNRESDQAGWEYWSGQINQCNGRASCLSTRRLDVSAGFFMSAEFQQSAAYLYRLYLAAFGDQPGYRPAFAQFMADRASLFGGTGLPQWQMEFANQFVARSEFSSRYPSSLSVSGFVDAVLKTLEQGTGLVLKQAERDSLITDVESGGRGVMMGHLAEMQGFTDSPLVLNRGFVLMEYFGYLRRDPDQAGYQYWVDILSNREVGNYRGMVCSFLNSAEYQERFAPVVTHTSAECGP